MALKISKQAMHLWQSATNHLRARGARSVPVKRTMAQEIFNSAASARLSDHVRGAVSPIGGVARPASEVKR
jgi:hypothetical protein